MGKKPNFEGAPDTDADKAIQQEILDDYERQKAIEEKINESGGGMSERDGRGGTSGGGQVERRPNLDEQEGSGGDD